MSKESVDHLKEYIKGWIEFQKERIDCTDMTDEEVEYVIKNIQEIVG